ncbi:MAG: hypothetical protein JXR76_15530 [Deltaproteobacteria bacterium]|nr:hypothetical protein [Deltaproteobacteria bacterium]
MYRIETKEYGYRLTFGDMIDAEEMKAWLAESKVILENCPASFGVFVDMRTLVPLRYDAQPFMEEGQKLYRKSGMSRSVVILSSAATSMQFRRIARETGIAKWERYIDAGKTENWEEAGLAWVIDGVEPK